MDSKGFVIGRCNRVPYIAVKTRSLVTVHKLPAGQGRATDYADAVTASNAIESVSVDDGVRDVTFALASLRVPDQCRWQGP